MRKGIVGFIFLLLLSFGLFFTKNQWLALGTKYALNKKFPDAVVYKQIKAQDGKVCIGQIHIHEADGDLTLNGVEFGLKLKELIKHPKTFVSLYKQKNINWAALVQAIREYKTELSIDQGVLQLGDYRYHFQLKQGKKRHEIATLTIGHDPASLAHPFLVVQFQSREDQVVAQVSVDQVSTAKFFQLAAFAFPELLRDFSNPGGTLQFHATLAYSPQGQLEEYAVRFACEDFEMHHPRSQLACQMHHVTGSLNYPAGINHEHFPVWKKIQCGLVIEEGNVVIADTLAVTHLQGTAVLDPQQDPEMDISGELVGEETPLALHLGGKGVLHDDKAYWLEFILNLKDRQGTDCGATFSLCRPENDTLVFQLEADNLLPKQVEMLKCYLARVNPSLHQWEILKGVFGGKLVAVLDKGSLTQLEVQDFRAESVAIATQNKEHQFDSITGEGSLYGEMDFVATLSAPCFFGLLSDEWEDIYSNYRPKDHAQVALTFRKEKAYTQTSAHVEFLETEQSFQFGYKSQSFFPQTFNEITDGWVRAEKLSHLLYGPFISLVAQDLEIYGQMDLIAAFDGQKVQASIQMGEFLSKHPFVDLKAPMIGERSHAAHRAKLTYELATGHFQGTVPLRGARIYERQYGLHLRDVDADLHISSDAFTAQVKKSQLCFDGQKLLKDAKFTFSTKQGPTLTALTATLPLATDRQFSLNIPLFTPHSCEIKLYNQEEQVAHFKGVKEKTWTGQGKLSAFKEPFAVAFHWDPLHNLAQLQAEQAGWSLSCQKENDCITIEKLNMGSNTFKASLTKNGDVYSLSHFELNCPQSNFEGSGTFTVTLPHLSSPFEVKGELTTDAHLFKPIELYAKAKHPFKVAYAPTLGLVLSGLDFATEGGHFEVGHLEWHQESQKTFLNSCAFQLAQEPLEALIQAKALPAFLKDLRAFQSLEGIGGGYLDKQSLHLQGVLKAEPQDLGFAFDWQHPTGKLTLTDGEKNQALQLQISSDKQQFHFESLKGSLCGISADLKKTKNQELKGQLTIDTSAFSPLLTGETMESLPQFGVDGKFVLEGLFTPKEQLEDWHFKGKIKGSSLKWHALSLGLLEAKLEIEPGQMGIEALDISDEAGKLWIGDGYLRRGSDGLWSYSFPLIELRNLQPTALGAEKRTTPFLIKTASLKNVRGRMGDLSSLVAEGSLRFTNVSKKGDKLIPKNFPFQALQRFGIDTSLLFPTGGDITYVIQNERLFIRGLESLFGEKRRFEWQAPRNSTVGFIDFDGNLAFDIQVKQFSGRSSSSPFGISVRGTLDDPQIAIK